MLSRKILKNRVSLMPFPVFWCGFLCMGQVTNEKKILKILVKLGGSCPSAPYAYGLGVNGVMFYIRGETEINLLCILGLHC